MSRSVILQLGFQGHADRILQPSDRTWVLAFRDTVGVTWVEVKSAQGDELCRGTGGNMPLLSSMSAA